MEDSPLPHRYVDAYESEKEIGQSLFSMKLFTTVFCVLH